MTRRRQALAAGGGLALTVALVVAVVPSAPSAAVAVDTALLAALGFAIGGVGFWTAIRSLDRFDDEAPFEQPPEVASEHDRPTVGEDIDEAYRELVERKYDTDVQYRLRRRRLRRQLRSMAVETLADAESILRQEARARIDDGSWTDDPRAASFLGASVDKPPLEIRIGDWLSGETIRRQVDHTIAELERLADLPDTDEQSARHLGTASGADTRNASSDVRGGGVDAGEMELTDASYREEATVTTATSRLDRTNHWEFGLVVAFALGGVGFALANVTVVLSGIVGLCYTIYGAATRPPELNVAVSRTVSDASPVPGEHVEVRIEARNVGERPIPELRLVDGVPTILEVTDGSPRACVSLEPGESTTTTYTIEARRGSHTFEGTSLWARNVSGDSERSVTAELDAELTCRDSLESVPVTGQTTPYQGRIETDTGGEGLAFFATREYQHKDPLSRIDWNYWAQTGDPRTVEFRQHRAGTVVVLLDDRIVSARSRDEHAPNAVTLGQYAAIRIAEHLLSESNAVGGALLALEEYERPSRGRDQLQTLQRFFEGETQHRGGEDGTETSSFTDVDNKFFQKDVFDRDTGPQHRMVRDGGDASMGWLRKRLPSDAQVFFLTPLLDDEPARICEVLRAAGTDVTVVSPDVTTMDGPGGTVARIERQGRLRTLRRGGIRIVDWDSDAPLSVALERAQHRWSR